LREPTPPSPKKIPGDSNVEMTWRVFGGEHHEIYAALLKERSSRDGFDADPETLAQQFRLHLHRGISYLAGRRDLASVRDIFTPALTSE
jgi:DNA sulfur modification protein DndE